MRVGELVKDKRTKHVGIITSAWIDENDATSVIVEFFEKKEQVVYWSVGMFVGAGTRAMYNTNDLEIVEDDD